MMHIFDRVVLRKLNYAYVFYFRNILNTFDHLVPRLCCMLRLSKLLLQKSQKLRSSQDIMQDLTSSFSEYATKSWRKLTHSSQVSSCLRLFGNSLIFFSFFFFFTMILIEFLKFL